MKYINVFLIFITFLSCKEAKKPNEYPDLTVKFSNGTEMNLREIEANAVLVLYLPNCDHCQRQVASIKKEITSFKNYGLFFITTSDFQSINAFAKEYKLDNYANVYFVQANFPSIINTFGSVDTPTMFIYQDGSLAKQFSGETPIDKVLRIL